MYQIYAIFFHSSLHAIVHEDYFYFTFTFIVFLIPLVFCNIHNGNLSIFVNYGAYTFFPEIPAQYIDPAAIDLTPLVNTLINSTQSGKLVKECR